MARSVAGREHAGVLALGGKRLLQIERTRSAQCDRLAVHGKRDGGRVFDAVAYGNGCRVHGRAAGRLFDEDVWSRYVGDDGERSARDMPRHIRGVDADGILPFPERQVSLETGVVHNGDHAAVGALYRGHRVDNAPGHAHAQRANDDPGRRLVHPYDRRHRVADDLDQRRFNLPRCIRDIDLERVAPFNQRHIFNNELLPIDNPSLPVAHDRCRRLGALTGDGDGLRPDNGTRDRLVQGDCRPL